MDFKTKIALIDDDSFCLTYYSQVLNEIGFGNLYHFTSGTDILTKNELSPDIIFLDYYVDGVFGVDLVKALQKKYPNVEIVILSGQKDMNTTIELMNCGILDYIVKDENDNIKVVEVMRQYITSKKIMGTNKNNQNCPNSVKSITEIQMKIRKEISDELHDNVNQLLGASKLYIETAKSNSEKRVELLDESKKILETAINEIRKISHNLVFDTTKKEKFIDSLSSLLDFLSKQDRFNFFHNLKPKSLDRFLTADQKHNLLRILQETINNAFKYSEATNISIISKLKKNSVSFLVKDDGKGFNPKKCKNGIGLNNIYNRISLMNAEVDLEAQVGKGCCWKINIPLQGNTTIKDLAILN